MKRGVELDEPFRDRVLESLGTAGRGALDRGSVLFLERPEGWEEELELLVGQIAEDEDRSGSQKREAAAVRRADQLQDALGRARAERDGLASELESHHAEVASLRKELAEREVEADQAAERADRLAAEREEAVRQLKEAEAIAARRLEELREARAAAPEPGLDSGVDVAGGDGAEAGTRALDGASSVESAQGAPMPNAATVDPGHAAEELAAEIAPALAKAADAAGDLAQAISELNTTVAGRASIDDPPATHPVPADTDSPKAPRRRRDRSTEGERRKPVRPGRGLSSDSVDGLREFLRRPETFVIIDGYNVSMQGWPTLSPAQQRDALVSALAPLSGQSAADLHVVFDGAFEGQRPSVDAPLPVRVHFTEAGVEADDRILEFVDDAPLDDAVVVVSSDARVRDGARERGATAVSSHTLLDRLRSR